MSSALASLPETKNKTVLFTVANGKISQAVGQNKMNVSALKKAFKLKNIKFGEDEGLSPFEISLTVLNT